MPASCLIALASHLCSRFHWSHILSETCFLKQNFAWRMSVPFTKPTPQDSAFMHQPRGWIFYHCSKLNSHEPPNYPYELGASWLPITLMKQILPNAIFTTICYQVKSSKVASLAIQVPSTLRLITIWAEDLSRESKASFSSCNPGLQTKCESFVWSVKKALLQNPTGLAEIKSSEIKSPVRVVIWHNTWAAMRARVKPTDSILSSRKRLVSLKEQFKKVLRKEWPERWLRVPGGFRALQRSVDRDSVYTTAHTEKRWDKEDSEIHDLETEKTKKSGNLGDGQEAKEKQHLPSLPSEEWESLFDFFLLIHFDILRSQQVPFLPVLFASDTPLLSQYWSSSQTGWRDTHRRSVLVSLHYWSTSTKKCC